MDHLKLSFDGFLTTCYVTGKNKQTKNKRKSLYLPRTLFHSLLFLLTVLNKAVKNSTDDLFYQFANAKIGTWEFEDKILGIVSKSFEDDVKLPQRNKMVRR